MNKIAARIALSLLVAAALVALLLEWSGTRPGELARRLGQLEPEVIASSTAILGAIYLTRGMRFWILLGRGLRPPLPRCLAISGVHGFAAYFVPAKLGEAAAVVLLRRYGGVSGAHGVAVLVVARLLDLTAVTGSLGAACLTLAEVGAYPELLWLAPLGGLLVGLMVVFGTASLQGPRLVRLAIWGLRRLGFERAGLGRRLMALLARIAAALAEVERVALWKGAALSLVVWLGVYLYYAVLAWNLGLAGLGFEEAVFGSSLAVLANLLPVNGFAGFGTQDAAWVVGFTALGVSKGLATESALAFHLVYVLHICLFGLLGQGVLWALGPRRR